jgi:hypothetical protein
MTCYYIKKFEQANSTAMLLDGAGSMPTARTTPYRVQYGVSRAALGAI